MTTVKSQIVICGAGTAGLPAALAAARNGSSVTIIEEDGQIGGAAVDFGIQNYCGGPVQGMFREIREEMLKIAPPCRNTYCFRASSYVMGWNNLFSGLPIQIYTRQKIKKVICQGSKISAVESETMRFEGDVFIDATGDAVVAAKTPCVIRYGRESKHEFGERFAPEKADDKVQMCTMMFTVRRKADCPHNEDANWAVLDSEEFLIWGPTVSCEDTTDPDKLAEAQKRAMDMMAEYKDKYDKKGFYITGIAPKLGVRESRRIEGNYILSYNDVMSEKTYPDSIGVVEYCIDPWDPEGNPVHSEDTVNSTKTPPYEIPYRCLVTDKVSNLITAGRTISSTHVVNSSLRVMGIVHIIGQAAGNAAYLAVRNKCGVTDIPVGELREMLRKQKVFVSLNEFKAFLHSLNNNK